MKQQKTYVELLLDPRWQRRRLEIFQRDNWTCQECGDKKSTLHVHHLKYVKGKKPWEYSKKDLIALCEECHEEKHEEEKERISWEHNEKEFTRRFNEYTQEIEIEIDIELWDFIEIMDYLITCISDKGRKEWYIDLPRFPDKESFVKCCIYNAFEITVKLKDKK